MYPLSQEEQASCAERVGLLVPSRGVEQGHCLPALWDGCPKPPSPAQILPGGLAQNKCYLLLLTAMAEPGVSAWLGLPTPRQIGSYQGLGTALPGPGSLTAQCHTRWQRSLQRIVSSTRDISHPPPPPHLVLSTPV